MVKIEGTWRMSHQISGEKILQRKQPKALGKLLGITGKRLSKRKDETLALFH